MVFDEINTKACNEPVIGFIERRCVATRCRPEAAVADLLRDLLGWISADQVAQAIESVLQ